jgi:hypothetical protein
MKKLALLAMLMSVNACASEMQVKQILVEHVDSMPVVHVQTKSAMCTASANPASGKAPVQLTASGYVSYVITNNTSTTQGYNVDEYMCINGIGCTHVRQAVTLGAHMSANGGGAISTSQYIANKGTYIDQSSIQVSGESTCFVQGSNTVTVS